MYRSNYVIINKTIQIKAFLGPLIKKAILNDINMVATDQAETNFLNFPDFSKSSF